MAYPVTLNGRTYTLADFEGTNYVDGFPDALEDFVTHAGNLYSTTSTTSNSIGTGSKTFTVESSKPYQVGTPLRITDSAAPSTNWIDAIVTAYSGTTLTVDAVAYAGSGTKTSWNINIGGGGTSYTGTLPIAQGGTGATTAAAARTNLDTYSKSEADSRFLNVSGEASDVTMNGNVTIGSEAADILTVNATPSFTQQMDVTDTIVTDRLKWRLSPSHARGLVSSSSSLHSISGDGTTYGYGISTNVAGGLDIMANQAGQNIAFYAGTANSGTINPKLTINSNGSLTSYPTGGTTAFNEDGVDSDFRVESDSKTHMLFVDGGNNLVGINHAGGGSDASMVAISNDPLHPAVKFGSHINTNGFNLLGDNYKGDETILNIGLGYSGANPIFARSVKPSTTAESAFVSSQDTFNAQPAALEIKNDGFRFYHTRTNATTTVDSAVTLTSFLHISGDGVIANDAGTSDADFRVESDGVSGMLSVDAGNDRVNIGTSGSSYASSIGDGLGDLRVGTSSYGLSVGVATGGGGAGDTRVWTKGGTENLIFSTATSNSQDLRIGKTDTVLNESGSNRDFRVESDAQTNMLGVDAGEDTVVIRGAAANQGHDLAIHGSYGISGQTAKTFVMTVGMAGSATKNIGTFTGSAGATCSAHLVGASHYSTASIGTSAPVAVYQLMAVTRLDGNATAYSSINDIEVARSVKGSATDPTLEFTSSGVLRVVTAANQGCYAQITVVHHGTFTPA